MLQLQQLPLRTKLYDIYKLNYVTQLSNVWM